MHPDAVATLIRAAMPGAARSAPPLRSDSATQSSMAARAPGVSRSSATRPRSNPMSTSVAGPPLVDTAARHRASRAWAWVRSAGVHSQSVR